MCGGGGDGDGEEWCDVCIWQQFCDEIENNLNDMHFSLAIGIILSFVFKY